MLKVDIIIPAHNESKILEKNIFALYNFLKKQPTDFKWTIIIGENASSDNTLEIAKKLSKKYKEVKWSHSDIPSRDIVLKKLWTKSNADILAYMDADLSTDISYFPKLVRAIKEGNDIAIGSRLKKGSKVNRPPIRILMSNIYNKFIIPIILPTGVKDAQCGFKAINKKTAKELLPKLGNYNGFLDTEMLAVAHYKKYKIEEIPVRWREDRKSTMSVWKNIPNFLKNLIKTRKKILCGKY